MSSLGFTYKLNDEWNGMYTHIKKKVKNLAFFKLLISQKNSLYAGAHAFCRSNKMFVFLSPFRTLSPRLGGLTPSQFTRRHIQRKARPKTFRGYDNLLPFSFSFWTHARVRCVRDTREKCAGEGLGFGKTRRSVEVRCGGADPRGCGMGGGRDGRCKRGEGGKTSRAESSL